MLKSYSKKLTISSLMVAIGIILPYVTAHGFGISGNIFLPMHIPVLLCGFFCGPLMGAVCGLLLPILNSVLTGMPALFPMAPIMTFELFTYGLFSGLIYRLFSYSKSFWKIGISLIIAMILGRCAYGIMCQILILSGANLGKISVAYAVVTGIPGIIVQLFIIPGIVLKVRKSINLTPVIHEKARNMIKSGKANCIVVKDEKIICKSSDRGIAYIIKLYEEGKLKDAYVADKIIGKAAAMIFTLGGVSALYGETTSQSALKWLTDKNTSISYTNNPEYIINRKGDGMCPMEETVADIYDEKEAYAALKNKIKQLKNK